MDWNQQSTRPSAAKKPSSIKEYPLEYLYSSWQLKRTRTQLVTFFFFLPNKSSPPVTSSPEDSTSTKQRDTYSTRPSPPYIRSLLLSWLSTPGERKCFAPFRFLPYFTKTNPHENFSTTHSTRVLNVSFQGQNVPKHRVFTAPNSVKKRLHRTLRKKTFSGLILLLPPQNQPRTYFPTPKFLHSTPKLLLNFYETHHSRSPSQVSTS